MTTDDQQANGGNGIDTTVPHSARIWNYWLGGKDNYEVDRAAGDAWLATDPHARVVAREGRAFLKRAVRYLAGEAGIRQFLDVGTGLPTAENTHEVAQQVAPNARIVYVDNDPLVLAHARALMTSNPAGATHYLHADMLQPEQLLEGASAIIDFDQPIAVIFMGVLGHVPSTEEARTLIHTLMNAAAPGSYLLIGDGIESESTATIRKAAEEYSRTGAVAYHIRPFAELRSFFDGLEMVEPGLVSITQWRPAQVTGIPTIGKAEPDPLDSMLGGLARKRGASPT